MNVYRNPAEYKARFDEPPVAANADEAWLDEMEELQADLRLLREKYDDFTKYEGAAREVIDEALCGVDTALGGDHD